MIRATQLAAVAFAAALVAAASAPAVAAAHIQVNPTVAAPNDAVKFTLLVPGERSQQTTRVAVKIPSGLLPFSFADTPGWTRKLVKASNDAIDQIVWSGRLATDGFAEFSFLAGTPERAGTLVFKALQTYSDGKVVRWIGAPDSENPAPVTRVEKSAPRQNAGGETNGGGRASAGQAHPAAIVAPAATPAPADDSGSNPLAVVLGAGGLLLGAAALVVALRTRRRAPV